MRLYIWEVRDEMRGEPLVELTEVEARVWEGLSRRSLEWLEPRQKRVELAFGLDPTLACRVNEKHQVFFGREEGQRPVVADMVWVGTWRLDGWVWGWHNDFMPRYSREQMETIKRWGEEMELRPLTCGWLEASEMECRGLAAVCAERLGAEGIWRTPGEDRGAFMLLYNLRWG